MTGAQLALWLESPDASEERALLHRLGWRARRAYRFLVLLSAIASANAIRPVASSFLVRRRVRGI